MPNFTFIYLCYPLSLIIRYISLGRISFTEVYIDLSNAICCLHQIFTKFVSAYLISRNTSAKLACLGMGDETIITCCTEILVIEYK